MKQVTVNGKEILIVPVPEDYHSPSVRQDSICPQLQLLGSIGELWITDLPSGSWLLLGKGDEITEEQWGKIIESYYYSGETRFHNYTSNKKFLDTATESSLSLIRSHSFEPTKVIILLKTD